MEYLNFILTFTYFGKKVLVWLRSVFSMEIWVRGAQVICPVYMSPFGIPKLLHKFSCSTFSPHYHFILVSEWLRRFNIDLT